MAGERAASLSLQVSPEPSWKVSAKHHTLCPPWTLAGSLVLRALCPPPPGATHSREKQHSILDLNLRTDMTCKRLLSRSLPCHSVVSSDVLIIYHLMQTHLSVSTFVAIVLLMSWGGSRNHPVRGAYTQQRGAGT